MSADTLSHLISKTALGDRSAFATLYSMTSAKLFGVTLRLLQNRHDAEEALQEVYVKIWQRASQYARGQTSPMAWLCTIARHQAIDMIRARKATAVDIDDAWDIEDLAPGPEHLAVMSSEGRRIDHCMRQLDADKAAAVRNAYVEGLSYEELAAKYQVPLNTIRTWLRRSLIKLKECLEQ
jgi:RNA polymerase sigma-70 factor (ECF subfamily)